MILLVVLLVIVALLGLGLQLFLSKVVTRTLDQKILPAIQSQYGLDIRIENTTANLFKGRAELRGLSIRNLKGYDQPTLLTFEEGLLELDLKSFIKRNPIVIKLAQIKGATLTVERNKKGMFNVKEFAEVFTPVESLKEPLAPQKKPLTPVEKKVKTLPIHIRRIAVDATLVYADTTRERERSLELRLTGSDLFTVPVDHQPDSLLVLRGALAHDDQAFVTDMNAIVEPLTDLVTPSFRATGQVLGIDATLIQEWLEKNDMDCQSFAIKPSITCQQGRLDGSRIDLILNQFKIYDVDIGNPALQLPLGGTLKKPLLDLTAAIQTLFAEQSVDILKAISLKKLGVSSTNTPGEMLVQGLTQSVDEIADSPKLQSLIQQIVPGTPSTGETSSPLRQVVSDVLFEQLENNVKELDGNDAIQDSLKKLGNSLFGK